MILPVESFIEAGDARYRTLTWGNGEETVLFLHGLTGVAEVWSATVGQLAGTRRYIAMDARGHGRTTTASGAHTAVAMRNDARRVIGAVGGPVHLVGHSMGARTAILVASRWPELLHSVCIVDIGPEASNENIAATVRGIGSRPERFATRAEALAVGFRNRTATADDERVFLARLAEQADGSWTWRAKREALVDCVTRQRSRSYWHEWRSVRGHPLYIRGSASTEVSVSVAAKMRAENPGIRFEQFEGIGHNIPILAPQQLAVSLERHWTTAPKSAT